MTNKILSLLLKSNQYLSQIAHKTSYKIKKYTSINIPMPSYLTIGTTMKCNLRCTMCRRITVPEIDINSPTMDIKLYRKIANEVFPYLKTVNFSVGGEPLASENIFEEMRLARKFGVDIELTTNGTLMGSDELIETIVNSVSILNISFDAATKETYESIRRGADYAKVIQNIKRFNNTRRNKNKPRLQFCIVLMRSNIEELPQWVELTKQLEADFIFAAHVVIHSEEFKNESLIFHKELANKYITQASEIATKLGMNFSFPALYNPTNNLKDINESKRKKCPYLWENSWIECNGDVVPCCNPRRPVVGNLYKQSFKDIWNGQLYEELRRRISSDNPMEMCKHCYLIEQFRNPEDEASFILTEKST